MRNDKEYYFIDSSYKKHYYNTTGNILDTKGHVIGNVLATTEKNNETMFLLRESYRRNLLELKKQ